MMNAVSGVKSFSSELSMRLPKIKSSWDGDCNTRPEDGGTYDILVNLIKKLKNEVKTAFSCESSANWQHENIYAKLYGTN